MRLSLATLALALAGILGLAAPAATPTRAAAPDGAKVVIIVGATHGTTDRYRDYANQAYAEAIKYTSNVVKVYSPNATWTKVKAAAVGASIVIYFGHGNGWPSPYTYDPKYTTKDGFGLNAAADNGDYNTKYYGEPYVAQLDLAPNAIVMLHHLCYASGNSEPGDAAPSLATAKKRVDNFAAGFLRTKARAVLAEGLRGPAEYLRAIFTTDQTIDELWRGASNANGNVISFASTRTPGETVQMDPKTPSSGFYRALTGDPNLTTREIAGGFSVPGRAAAQASGTPIYDDAPTGIGTTALTPAAVLPADTRLRVLETVSGTGDSAIFRIEGLDDPSIGGYAIARDLEPRDSLAPRVLSVTGGAGKAYSTVATGGTHKLSGTLNERTAWTATVTRGSTVVASKAGTGTTAAVTFDPAQAGTGDGSYDYEITGVDDWANGPSSTSGSFVIDSTGPTGTAELDGGAATAVVGIVRVGLEATDSLTEVARVRLANKADVDGTGLLSAGTTYAATNSVAWTLPVGKGARTVYAQWQDAAGNWSAVKSDAITVDPPDTTYRTVTPVRLLDTRSNIPSGVTRLTSGKPIRFAVAGRGGVPDDAIAVTGNLTVTGQTSSGYVTLGPIVGPSPTTSTINVPKGDTRANGVVVPLDRSGRLEAVYKGGAGSTAQLVLDVTGYFTADDAGSGYTSLTPARFLDTRVVTGATGGAALQPDVPQAIRVGGRTVGSMEIPLAAVAVTGNLTVTGQTGSGYLALTPTAQAAPATSTLNFPKGDVRANNVTVPLGSEGRVWAVYKGSGGAHAVLDITGFYREGTEGLRWVPLAPARVLDSRSSVGRSGPFAEGTPGSVTVVSKGGIAADAIALTGNLTVTGQTRKGYTALTPTPVAAPTTSTLNFPTGEARANGVVSRMDGASGKVSLTYMAGNGATTHLVLDVTGYFH
ncbi:MAG: hypothetical protein ABIQ58_04800 [Candidatus Limnocylindrales bacterium]